MLHISTFGSRIFHVDMDVEKFRSTWASSANNHALMDLETTDGRVLVPCAAVSSITVD